MKATAGRSARRAGRAPPHTIVDVGIEVVAGLAWLGGLATWAVVMLAVRLSERSRASVPVPAPSLPAGLAAVLAVLPSSAMVLDTSDRVVRASAAAWAFGFVSGDRLQVEELVRLAQEVRRYGEIRDTEIESPGGRIGQEPRAFAVRVAPLATQNLVLILAEDRTEARRIEAVRRDFVANVSHELKTPVGALSLLAETTEDAAEEPAAVRRFAGRMRHEAARLASLVQELITLSLLEGAGAATQHRDVRLADVVAEAADRCRLIASAKGIGLVVDRAADLHVLGDEDLLVTAVRNLIDNAVAYSAEHTQVTVAIRRRDGRAEVSVADQGIGIAERNMGRIFERFYRVDSARSRSTGGTGLGLAIVKHVVANHGGEVSVKSREGVGSTFTLRLPLLTAKSVGRRDRPAAVAGSGSAGGPRRVLSEREAT